MSIKPLADRVLILPQSVEEKTACGIILPDSAKEKQFQGRIVNIGDKVENLSVGDVVLYNKNKGTEVELNDVKHLIIRQEDILAIVK